MGPKEQYYGPWKVAAVVELEYKTPKGADMVKVMLDDGVAPEVMPKATFERLVSETPVDLTTLRDNRYKPVLEELASVLLEHDIKFMDLAYVGKALVNKIEDAFERASSFLWTGDPKAWIPGVDYRGDLTAIGAEQVLRSIKSDESDTTQDS